MNFQYQSNGVTPTIDYYSVSDAVLEAVTFSKTHVFVSGYKVYGDYKCPVIGRLDTSLTLENLQTYDCSSGGISYNVKWIDRRMDEVLNGMT